MCTPTVGTTLVHMGRLYDSNTATMSWTFTVMAVGYLLGAIMCGFIFDRINHELQLLIANCIEAATIAAAPFFTTLPMYIAVLSVHACSMGFIDASKIRLSSDDNNN